MKRSLCSMLKQSVEQGKPKKTSCKTSSRVCGCVLTVTSGLELAYGSSATLELTNNTDLPKKKMVINAM